MKLKQRAFAGTDNREDLKVMIEPAGAGIQITVHSSVLALFGSHIEVAAKDLLNVYQIEACRMEINDRSALDYAVRARIETAILRAMEDC